MSKQMQQDLQNELIIANQLLYQISIELQQIKNLTNPDGIFETNIKENASIIKNLANIQKLNLDNLPATIRKPAHHFDNNQRNSNKEDNTFRNN